MIATQQVAAAFRYPREFGPGLFDSGTLCESTRRGRSVGWYFRFGDVYPKAFDLAGLIALGVALVPSMFGGRAQPADPPRAAEVRRGGLGGSRRRPEGQAGGAGA